VWLNERSPNFVRSRGSEKSVKWRLWNGTETRINDHRYYMADMKYQNIWRAWL